MSQGKISVRLARATEFRLIACSAADALYAAMVAVCVEAEPDLLCAWRDADEETRWSMLNPKLQARDPRARVAGTGYALALPESLCYPPFLLGPNGQPVSWDAELRTLEIEAA